MRIQIHQRQLANARGTFVRMSEAFPDDPITTRAEARLALAENRPADAAKLLRGLYQSDNTVCFVQECGGC